MTRVAQVPTPRDEASPPPAITLVTVATAVTPV
ncbi:MAG: hypothetical protein QOG99_3507, partial [Frankiales bacterium]|nr:hypothetical protein [Frankiales bacterium]